MLETLEDFVGVLMSIYRNANRALCQKKPEVHRICVLMNEEGDSKHYLKTCVHNLSNISNDLLSKL